MSSMIATKTSKGNLTKETMQIMKEKIDLVDFKMVTFSLAGKDYGIDIMKVKEIARFVNFTYVPNTPNFVRGVYNLRGDIISIIDLRAMFNLPYKQKASNEEEAGLIIRLDNNLIGVVVDKIDKVVGINSQNIQPPHPIFGDINIKFISGVVENDNRLYIILDVDKVLGKPEDRQERSTEALPMRQAPIQVNQELPDPRAAYKNGSGSSDHDQNRLFIMEGLSALMGFTVNAVNQQWFDDRYSDWEASRKGNQVQIKSADESKVFLETFYSPHTAQLWSQDYIEALLAALPEQTTTNQINVWNPGCGRGYESYSLAVALRKKYPEARIKIWASDKDLLNVSNAPNLVFADREIPEHFMAYMVDGKNGKSFSTKIKEMILFEYHDMVNDHSVPPLDLVLCRDVVSFLSKEAQASVFRSFSEKVKHGGMVILGKNEVLPGDDMWTIHKYPLMSVARHS